MKWLKYNHKFSYGDEETKYKLLGTMGDDYVQFMLEDWISELESEFSYSDKYRGINYEVVDDSTIDLTYLKKFLDTSISNKKYYTDLVINLEEIVKWRKE